MKLDKMFYHSLTHCAPSGVHCVKECVCATHCSGVAHTVLLPEPTREERRGGEGREERRVCYSL